MPRLDRFPSTLLAGALALAAAARGADIPVTVQIDPGANRAAISPFIYGTNQDIAGTPFTAFRSGGNRTTGYNWENNASNAGSDYNQQSDDFMTWAEGIPAGQANVPGIAITTFHDRALARGSSYSVVTLQLAGYVAKDKAGPVAVNEAAPSSRWVPVSFAKGSAFTTTPNAADGFVYMDEFVNFLTTRYGAAGTANGVRGYDLDNEPDLWSSTHPRLHPAQPTCVELVTRNAAAAQAVKRVDPAADTLGFVSYGFNGYYSFQGAPDWATEKAKGNYRWFVDYYLDQMKQASATAGIRLLDVLDVHNYSEHVAGGLRVNNPGTWENTDCNKGRMQAPRSLWDPTFVENSWIGQYFASFLPFIPNLKAAIATFYPGTKLAFTEYNFGGESHVSGGIAQADALGIYGRQGVYLATWWQLHDNPTYIAAAFNLYRNYDGAAGKFGGTSVSSSVSDNATCSVYASVDPADETRLHVILLNKSYDQPAAASIQIAGPRTWARGRVYAFDSASAALTERAAITTITGNQLSYTLAPLTAAHLVLTAAVSPPQIRWQNLSTGERCLWQMNGTAYGSTAYLGVIPPAWRMAGTGDFNADGQPDLLWQNTTTGECYVWLMNGTTFTSSVFLGVIPTAWQIATTGDFNGDGKPDILWQNSLNGDRIVWFMNGTTYAGSADLGIVPLAWQIAAAGDFNGDGKPDLLWQNTTTGERYLWLMNGTTFTSSVLLGVMPVQWQIAATGDFNGDGKPDLVWQNTTTGERYLWLMNGTTFASSVFLGVVPTAWSIAP